MITGRRTTLGTYSQFVRADPPAPFRGRVYRTFQRHYLAAITHEPISETVIFTESQLTLGGAMAQNRYIR